MIVSGLRLGIDKVRVRVRVRVRVWVRVRVGARIRVRVRVRVAQRWLGLGPGLGHVITCDMVVLSIEGWHVVWTHGHSDHTARLVCTHG